MKLKAVFFATLVMALVINGSLGGCARAVVVGSGSLVSDEMGFNDFTRLRVSHTFEVEVTQGDSYRVAISADDNMIQYLKVTKSGNTVSIGLEPVRTRGIFPRSVTLRAEIVMPSLDRIDLSGTSRATVNGFNSGDDLEIDTSGASAVELVGIAAGKIRIDSSGASRVTGQVVTGDADFDVSGASTVELTGSGGDIVTDVSGASHLQLGEFPVRDAKIDFNGASSGTIDATGTIDVDLSGASRLSYMGEPNLGSIDVTGVSNMSRE